MQPLFVAPAHARRDVFYLSQRCLKKPHDGSVELFMKRSAVQARQTAADLRPYPGKPGIAGWKEFLVACVADCVIFGRAGRFLT